MLQQNNELGTDVLSCTLNSAYALQVPSFKNKQMFISLKGGCVTHNLKQVTLIENDFLL